MSDLATNTTASVIEKLPANGDWRNWTPSEQGMLEFAGLGKVVIRETDGTAIWDGAPRGAVEAFLHAAQRTGLDPFVKQIYCIKLGGKWTIVVGVDGMRVVAQRTGEYEGQTAKEWLYPDGEWRTYWQPTLHGGNANEKPMGARVGIWRKGFREPLFATVMWSEFGKTQNQWATQPAHMIGIRAETHALRAAFPMQLSGLYTAEDFDGQAPADAEVIETRDWAKLIKATETRAELRDVWAEIERADEWTQHLRGLIAAHGYTLPADERSPEQAREQAEQPAEGSESDESAPEAQAPTPEAPEVAERRTAPDPDADPVRYGEWVDEQIAEQERLDAEAAGQ